MGVIIISSRISMSIIILFTSNISYTYFFSDTMHFFSCLIALARTSGTILNISNKSKHTYPAPEFWSKEIHVSHTYHINCMFFLDDVHLTEEVLFLES